MHPQRQQLLHPQLTSDFAANLTLLQHRPCYDTDLAATQNLKTLTIIQTICALVQGVYPAML